MEPRRPTGTRPQLKALAAVVTIGVLGGFGGAVLLPTEAMAVAAHVRPSPSPTPTATSSPTPSPTPTAAPSSGGSLASSPSPDPYGHHVSPRAAVSNSAVWAVGTAGANALAEHRNGSSWRIVPTPKPAGSEVQAQLLGVPAITSNDVWAVALSAS